jgi:hypothetical protein
MRVVYSSIIVSLGDASRSYQYDAPQGRWLNGEYSPKLIRPALPSGAVAACPVDFDFCIDARWSDPRTCLHPLPHLIKRCFDESCIQSSFGAQRAESRLEDTYCKDFMDVEGRVCQYNDMLRCECPLDVEDVVYANALVVHPGEAMPPGYRHASECVYPSANIKRLQNGGYVDPPLPGQPAPPPIPDHPKLKGNPNWTDPVDFDDVPTRPPLRPKGSSFAELGQGSPADLKHYPSAAGLVITFCAVFMII